MGIATTLFETQIMDVLQALILKANLDLGNAEPNPVMQRIKGLCQQCLDEAHKLGVIKTAAEPDKDAENNEERIEPWLRAPRAGTAGGGGNEIGDAETGDGTARL